MRRLLFATGVTVLFMLVMLSDCIGAGRWVSIGPEGEKVRVLVIDPQTPQTLYAGTEDKGIFKSTNGGNSWSPINTGLTNVNYVSGLAIDPQAPATLYAGSYRGIFRSTNGGKNWNRLYAAGHYMACGGFIFYYVAIDPQNPATLYIAANCIEGILKSTNRGNNWSDASTGLGAHGPTLGVRTLAIDPQTPATLYAGTSGGVFKSINGGDNWDPANAGLTGTHVITFAIDPQTPQTLYAGTEDKGIFKSTNGGINWSPANTGLTTTNVYALAITPQIPDTLYAGTDGGVFKSTNGGGSWEAVNTGLTNTVVNALAIDPQNPATVYAGTEGGGVFELEVVLPDLTGQWRSMTQACRNTTRGPKCRISGRLTIQNTGTLDASSSFVQFYLSDDAQYDEGMDTFLKQVATGTIKAGKNRTKLFSYSFPSGQTVSGKYVIAVIDADNAVEEANESNNYVVFGPIP